MDGINWLVEDSTYTVYRHDNSHAIEKYIYAIEQV